jgi:hypothetical protein
MLGRLLNATLGRNSEGKREGAEEEQRETGEYLIHAPDEDRLSDRPLFPRG